MSAGEEGPGRGAERGEGARAAQLRRLPPASHPHRSRQRQERGRGLSWEALGKVSVLSHGRESTSRQLLAELLRQVPAALGMLGKVFPSPSSGIDPPPNADRHGAGAVQRVLGRHLRSKSHGLRRALHASARDFHQHWMSPGDTW